MMAGEFGTHEAIGEKGRTNLVLGVRSGRGVKGSCGGLGENKPPGDNKVPSNGSSDSLSSGKNSSDSPSSSATWGRFGTVRSPETSEDNSGSKFGANPRLYFWNKLPKSSLVRE